MSGVREIRAAVIDYAGNHGDLSPGAVGMSTDFYFGGNGTGVLISSRALCENDRPKDWIDRLQINSVLDGSSNTILVGERHILTNTNPKNTAIPRTTVRCLTCFPGAACD